MSIPVIYQTYPSANRTRGDVENNIFNRLDRNYATNCFTHANDIIELIMSD